MSKVAVEYIVSGNLSAPMSGYDPTKLVYGTLLRYKTGANETDNWFGPHPIQIARMGQVASVSAGVHAVNWSPQYTWLFTIDVSTTTATRRVNYLVHDKYNDSLSYQGYITLNHSLPGNKIIRGLRANYLTITGGTVYADSTGVMGSGTNFTGDRICAGSRMGFGTTDPTQVTEWYEIAQSGIISNTVLNLTTPVSSPKPSGTPYVIEDLTLAYVATNATTTNGGLFLAKGLRVENFLPGGLNINDAGINQDNLRGLYWLRSTTGLTTETLATGCGLALDTDSSPTGRIAYVLNGGPNVNVYKYNIRAPLAVTGMGAGYHTGTFLGTTATGIVAGTMSQMNNGRIAVAAHGPLQNQKGLYFVSTTNAYACDVHQIYNGSSSWLANTMLEVPAGSASTHGASAAMSQIDYSDTIDAFYISTTTNRLHITKYKTDGSQFENIALGDNKQTDSNLADNGTIIFPNTVGLPMYVWTEDKYAYVTRSSTSTPLNHIYVVPFNTDWQYAAITNQRAITPKISTLGATRFYDVYVRRAEHLGSDAFTIPTEPCRVYARISGIDDNTGGWTLINNGSLDLVGASDYIQFMFEFRVFGPIGLPTRIYGLTVVYEDSSPDSHFQPSVANSNISTKAFAWRHAGAFGTPVPNLRVRLYDATNGNLLSDDNTSTPVGTFERSTNGGSNWSSWTNADKGNETTYIRYTPASLGDNIRVRALLSLL